MSYGTRFEQALVFAATRHRDQVRKGSGVPYVTHLLSVAALVGEHRGTEDQVIAALLHDAIEDQGVSRAELAGLFGAAVADIVAACTDATTHPKPPWRPRKEAFLQRLGAQDASVKLVVAADKLHNVRSILTDFRRVGVSAWSVFSASADDTVWYYRSATEALAWGWSDTLLDELHDAVTALEASPRR